MRTPILLLCIFGLFALPARAQETAGEKAAEAWGTTKQTAKNVGHTLKRGTKKAAHTVKEALTPDPDAHRVEVKVAPNSIDLPSSVPAGKAAFVVTNTSDENLTFEVERAGEEGNYAMTLAPKETKVLHVQLEQGKYHAGCLIKGRETQRKEVSLRVR